MWTMKIIILKHYLTKNSTINQFVIGKEDNICN